jgi:hypothetical protein
LNGLRPPNKAFRTAGWSSTSIALRAPATAATRGGPNVTGTTATACIWPTVTLIPEVLIGTAARRAASVIATLPVPAPRAILLHR